MPDSSPRLRSLYLYAVAGCVGCLLIAGAVGLQQRLETFDLRDARRAQRDATLRELYTVRYRLEAETISSLYLVTGLVAYIGAHPDFSQEEFARMGRSLFEAHPGLVNVAAAPDLVIRYVYPIEGNEKALGLDYNKNLDQRAAALAVKERGKPVVAGPVELVQGGMAIIARFPVFTGEGESRRFWGIVSTPLRVETLYEKAGLFDDRLPIEVAIRGENGTGGQGPAFFGDDALFREDSVRLPVNLFSGSWELGSIPEGGWIKRAPNAGAIRALVWGLFGTLLAVDFLVLAYVLRLERSRHREASLSHAKSKFLASMSHEIRTPLNAIYGVGQLLRDSKLDGDQSEWADIIVQSTRSLNELLTDILNLGKLESGKYQLSPEPIELEFLVESVIGIARIEAGRKGIAFRYSGVPAQRRMVFVDPVVLRQILWNLLSNAIKFTDSGEVRLDLEACDVRGSGMAGLRMVVSDTGIGISSERVASIFDEYVQEEPTIARQFGGTGLGLAIVKRLIDQLGGEISVKSRKGVGSRFDVVVPVRLTL